MKDNTTWNFGYMVELNLVDNIDFKLFPYKQYGNKATIELLYDNSFDTKLKDLNACIIDKSILEQKTDEYYSNNKKSELSILEPYYGRVLGKLFSLGLLPKFIIGKKSINILNHINCEAHRDKLIYALKNKK